MMIQAMHRAISAESHLAKPRLCLIQWVKFSRRLHAEDISPLPLPHLAFVNSSSACLYFENMNDHCGIIFCFSFFFDFWINSIYLVVLVTMVIVMFWYSERRRDKLWRLKFAVLLLFAARTKPRLLIIDALIPWFSKTILFPCAF